MKQSPIMETFAKNVRACLRAYGWTARGLADDIGVHEVTISRILNGKEGVTLPRAVAIADALGVDISDLLSEKFQIEAVPA